MRATGLLFSCWESSDLNSAPVERLAGCFALRRVLERSSRASECVSLCSLHLPPQLALAVFIERR